jgi:hypothetical protein
VEQRDRRQVIDDRHVSIIIIIIEITQPAVGAERKEKSIVIIIVVLRVRIGVINNIVEERASGSNQLRSSHVEAGFLAWCDMGSVVKSMFLTEEDSQRTHCDQCCPFHKMFLLLTDQATPHCWFANLA